MTFEEGAPRSWVSVLTPQGRGAVSVLEVWGHDALVVADAAFRPARGRSLAGSPTRRLRLGRVGRGIGDEVVAVVLSRIPPRVEIQCHGGPAAVALVLETLVSLGARVEPPERAVETRAASRLAAQAEVDLARAATLRTAEVLLDQQQGALDAALAVVEALAGTDPAAACAQLERLLARGEWGCRLADGWRVVLAGRPNVGKSRLLNAIAGFERAIVDATPGTTRDALTVRTAFDGWPVELCDTAGLRATAEPVEAAGVARARSLQSGADLVLLVLDRSEPLTEADNEVAALYPSALRVASKADLPAAWEIRDDDVAIVSAETGEGIEALIARVARRLVPDPAPPGAGVPFRDEQVRRLRAAQAALAATDVDNARRHLLAARGTSSES